MNPKPNPKVVLPPHLFALRMLRFFLYAVLLILISLSIGVLGYHRYAGLSWIDSLLNASMILTGMGPVSPMETDAAKLFSSFYALFSGIAFLSTVAIFLSPLAHRMLHKLHMDEKED
jgi:hypothetical protein